MILILVIILSLIVFHLIILVPRGRNSSEVIRRLVEVREPMSCLNVLLRFSLFLLLRNLINLVLDNHIRIVLLSSSSLGLFCKIIKAEFRISGIHFVREEGCCSGCILPFKCREEVVH